MPGLLESDIGRHVEQFGEDLKHGILEGGRHLNAFGRQALGIPEMVGTMGAGVVSMIPAGYEAMLIGSMDEDKRPMGFRDENGVWHPSLMGNVPMTAADAAERRMRKGIEGYHEVMPQSQYAQELQGALGRDFEWIADKANRYVIDPSIQSGVGLGLAAPVIGTGMAALTGILETLPGPQKAATPARLAARTARAADVPVPRNDRGLLEFAARHDPTIVSPASLLRGENPVAPDALARAVELSRQPGPVGPGRRMRGSVDDTGGGKEVAKAQATRAGILEVIPERELAAREFNEMSTGVRAQDEFNQKLSEARQSMDLRGRASVDEALPENFDGTTYITPDGMAGFALSKDGYISHLFRHDNAPFAGTMGAAMTKARAAGARNLDAIDAGLAESYISRNAVETGRGPWDESLATPEMIEAFGVEKPDYVSMNVGGVIPTQKHSLLVPGGPGRPQNLLERYVPPRGEPQAVVDAFKGGRVARLNRLVDRGLAEGGDQWYWMGGMLDQFIVELGPKLGVERFDKLMALNAAVSPRSTVNQQIKRSSILYQRHVRGEDITEMYQPFGKESNPKNLEPAFPEGYGHLAHNIHMDAVRALEGGKPLSPLSQQKIASYFENLRGNYLPITVDTHNYQILTGRKTSPTLAQYPYLESRQFALAQRRGLEPAEWQSALWVGGKDITGVKDARNFPDAMNQRIAKTAEALDIPEAEVMVRFINGDTQLYSVMAAMFLGPAAYEKLMSGEEPANGT